MSQHPISELSSELNHETIVKQGYLIIISFFFLALMTSTSIGHNNVFLEYHR